MGEISTMVIGCCAGCKYLDLVDMNFEILCPRCSGRMVPLGIRSNEWNELGEDEKDSIIRRFLPGMKQDAPAANENVSGDNSESGPADDVPADSKNSFGVNSGNIPAGDTPTVTRTAGATARRNSKYVSVQPSGRASEQTSGNSSEQASGNSSEATSRRTEDATVSAGEQRSASGRISKLSVISFILSVTGCLCLVGIILGIIDLTRKDGRKRGMSVAAVIIGAIMLIVSVILGAAAVTGYVRYVNARNYISEVMSEDTEGNMQLTIPKDFAEQTTQEECDRTASENGYRSVKLNDDGSVTYNITGAQHRAMMLRLKTSIDASLAQLYGPASEHPDHVKIVPNDDYTSFTIITKADSVNLAEEADIMRIYMYGKTYNVFSGAAADNIHIDFVNEATGAVIASSDSD